MAVFAVAVQTKDRKSARSDLALSKALNAVAEEQYRIEQAIFSIVEFRGTSAELTQALAACPNFDAATDILIVLNLSHDGYSTAGRLSAQLERIMERR